MGDSDCTIGGCLEHMTRTPMFSDVGGLDHMNPEPFTRFELVHPGESAWQMADKFKFSRQDADDDSMESHRRAAAAMKVGWARELKPDLAKVNPWGARLPTATRWERPARG